MKTLFHLFIYTSFLCLVSPFSSLAQTQTEITLSGSLLYTNTEGNDIWGYYDSISGKEYSLVGLENGFSVVDISNSSSPSEQFKINGPTSLWRDIKTWKNYAYVVHDYGPDSAMGLLIVDLDDMSGNTYTVFDSFDIAHNIFIDEFGFLYVFASNLGNNGVQVFDLNNNPAEPQWVGAWDDFYVHDGMVRNNILWACASYEGAFFAVDFSDKTNPIVLGTHTTPDNFAHNCWLSDDGNTLFTTDELSHGFVGSYDVSDLNNITELGVYQSNPDSGSIPHNTHVFGNFLVTSYYRDGVTIVDATHPHNMIEVGAYDSYDGSGNGFDGNWGAYPWLPSGKLITSDINSGAWDSGQLLIFDVNYIQACYLEGSTTEMGSGNPLIGVQVSILGTSNSTQSLNSGDYYTGTPASGLYEVVYLLSGYYPETLSVFLNNGQISTLDVELSPILPITTSGVVFDSESGDPIEGAQILITDGNFEYHEMTDGSGHFSISNFLGGDYNVVIGKWGYINYCHSDFLMEAPDTIYLERGYHDEFSLDLGWKMDSTVTRGAFQRVIPIGTTGDGLIFSPYGDSGEDCLGYAYVTGNGKEWWEDDMDAGWTELSSPAIDLSSYTDPWIFFDIWFKNGAAGGFPYDTLIMKLENGMESIILDTVIGSIPDWEEKSFQISSLIALSDSMVFKFYVSETPWTGFVITEAGIDNFHIDEMAPVGVESKVDLIQAGINLFPNPTNNVFFIETDDLIKYPLKNIEIYNASMQTIRNLDIPSGEERVSISTIDWSTGIYFVKINNQLKKLVISK